MPASYPGFHISLYGRVQGVGMRPYIWRLAEQLKLKGSVYNEAASVQIEIEASDEQLRHFLQQLHANLPPLAGIERLITKPQRIDHGEDFVIIPSRSGEESTGCIPDASICKDCRSELKDPNNRRLNYPFINCCNCGPRLSIIQSIPYDRANTTMAKFQQCPECLAEYNDPQNRRFHAQPNACSVCGPRLWLQDREGLKPVTDDPITHTAKALAEGKIVAVKGTGGFHLACLATDETVVQELRRRKNRPAKAFALMVKDLQQLERYLSLDQEVAELLQSSRAPIVLLDKTKQCEQQLAPSIAPGQYQLGFMLPNNGLHQLVMDLLEQPLVMTSGNLSGRPPAITNEDALAQLGEVADLFLLHDRPIANRVDDSVLRYQNKTLYPLRLARGFTPLELTLPEGGSELPDLLALGSDLKSSQCLLQHDRVVLSQHLGDLEDLQTLQQYQHNLALYQQLYRHKPRYVVTDYHPGYHSVKLGEQLEVEQNLKRIQVQHHHAHLAACLGENGYPLAGDDVLAICLDGTGYGLDESLWGGEFLYGSYQQVKRVAHLKPFPLVGGNQAVRQPWRVLFVQLMAAFPEKKVTELQGVFPALADKNCQTVKKMVERQFNTLQCSSVGRLFDAVAVALGCTDQISYEGQAAIELETLARAGDPDTPAYGLLLDLENNQINPNPLWQQLLQDLQSGVRSREDMARAFHKGVVDILVQQTLQLRKKYPFDSVALSGGVMQNLLLFDGLTQQLREQGVNLITQQKLPCNDGAIAYGQVLVAAAQIMLQQGRANKRTGDADA